MNLEYQNIIDLSENWSVPYARHHNSLVMKRHLYPVSITYCEFDFIKDFVQSHDIKNAYEIATGFGVSASAIGLGLKGRSGKLLTVDAYIEESEGSPIGYLDKEYKYYESDGFKSVHQLIDHFNLRDIIHAKVGWSPTDIPALLDETFGDSRIDFVFIDGMHRFRSVMMDLEAVADRLNHKFAVFFHDADHFNAQEIDQFEQMLGSRMIFPSLVHTYKLGYIANYD